MNSQVINGQTDEWENWIEKGEKKKMVKKDWWKKSGREKENEADGSIVTPIPYASFNFK